MDQEKFEKCLAKAHEMQDEYIAAYTRWFEKNRAWEKQVLAAMADSSSARDAWQVALASPEGQDALALLRDAELQKERTKYSMELVIVELRAMVVS